VLELKNIKKSYRAGKIETRALDDISVNFREREFVAILGVSGSGKTTFLNVIGGLDRYDSGEMRIKGKKTSDFTERDWDAYRNNSIGFVFQSYNLISHLSIVSNVELSMTLSGISAAERRRRAIDVLTKVGLENHLHKRPNQLSGGEMQRVAIARALSNDPEILLCDEPTGALDSTTGVQIMDLIRELSKDRLVIMVTHNPKIAEKYADRIIRFHDGKITSDTNPPAEEVPRIGSFKLTKTNMTFLTALGLSFNNLKMKKGRTFLTAFASSIGIIGIAVVLSLSTGFQLQIDQFQGDTMTAFPITISQIKAEIDVENVSTIRDVLHTKIYGSAEYADSDRVYLYDASETTIYHVNDLSEDYLEYLEAIDPEVCGNIGYVRLVSMNLVREVDGDYVPVSISSSHGILSSGDTQSVASRLGVTAGFSTYPEQLREGAPSYLEENYDLLAGRYPEDERDVVLVVDTKNRLDYTVLSALGFSTDGIESIPFSDIVGTQIRIISNDDYYSVTPVGSYLPGNNYEAMYRSKNSISITISGVVRQNPASTFGVLAPGLAYSDKLSQLVLENARESDIVKAQRESSRNVITMQEIDESEKQKAIAYLGGDPRPYLVMVYPENFDDKDEVLAYLDAYNEGRPIGEQIVYSDLAGTMTELTSGIMDGITIVLIAFAAVSLLVSLIMICIITYISVLERTKEIGVLRSLGARKKDITRVFDAETFILGVFSGLLGIFTAWGATFPINTLLYDLTELEGVAVLRMDHALLLVAISTVLTVLGGHIPAIIASRKDAVEALRAG